MRQRTFIETFRVNFARALEAKDLDMKTASEQASVGATFVRDVTKRGRDPRLSRIAKLAYTHGLSLDRLLELPVAEEITPSKVYVIGEAQTGVWRDPKIVHFTPFDSLVPPTPNHPIGAQFDLILRGNCVNLFAHHNSVLRCVGLKGASITTGDFVIVHRCNSQGLREVTARRYYREGSVIELRPESREPHFRAEQFDNRNSRSGRPEIVARVLFAYKVPDSAPVSGAALRKEQNQSHEPKSSFRLRGTNGAARNNLQPS